MTHLIQKLKGWVRIGLDVSPVVSSIEEAEIGLPRVQAQARLQIKDLSQEGGKKKDLEYWVTYLHVDINVMVSLVFTKE